jgi:hypothetical protein
MWHFYECSVDESAPIINSEIESITWKTFQEASELELVPVAQFLMKHVIGKRI